MSNFELNSSIVKGLFWSIFGKTGYIVIGLLSNILLARILTPFDFGQVGIVMFFIVLSKVLTESGLSGGLIRKNDASEEDYSTVFIFNLFVSLFLVILIVLFSNKIAEFYDDYNLKNILIVSSSILIINSFQIIKNVKLIKDLNFKKKANYEFVSVFFSSIIGVSFAYCDFGVWSIVLMQISNSFILTSMLWLFEPSLKKLVFSKKSFKNLYKFGLNTTFASLINSAFDNIYQLVLAKYFSINQTGLYYQGKKLQEIPVGVIKSTTLGVVFASLSKVQDDKEKFVLLYHKFVTFFSVLVGLICLFVFYYSKLFVYLMYGSKWLGSVFFVQILIVSSFFYIQEMFNRNIFKVYNKTEQILYLELVKKIIQSISIIFGLIFKDIEILLFGLLFTSFISFFINFYFSRKIIGLNNWVELLLILKISLFAAIVIVIGYGIENILNLSLFSTIYLLPLLLILYFIFIHYSKILNLRNDINSLIKTLKK